MFKKTSSTDYLKYGEVFTDFTRNLDTHQNNYILNITNDKLTFFYKSNQDIYLKNLEGGTMLIITDDLQNEKFDEYVIHRIIKINKGNYFNFIPLSTSSKIELAFQKNTSLKNVFIKNEYKYKRMKPCIFVRELIAYYYNVRSPYSVYPNEASPYWELIYVDSGTLFSKINNNIYTLSNNTLMLYGPSQLHEHFTKDETCSYLSIIIDLDFENMHDIQFLTNCTFDLTRDIKKMLDQFVMATTSDSKYSDYIMINSIESVIIELLCSSEKSKIKVASTPMQQNFENELLSQIILYINENIFSDFNNVDELCTKFGISRSSLQNLFKNNMNIAPKRYILNLKLNKSKELINESKYTLSEISTLLGFSSIHYFSRIFKQEFGISPTEYSNKIYKQ